MLQRPAVGSERGRRLRIELRRLQRLRMRLIPNARLQQQPRQPHMVQRLRRMRYDQRAVGVQRRADVSIRKRLRSALVKEYSRVLALAELHHRGAHGQRLLRGQRSRPAVQLQRRHHYSRRRRSVALRKRRCAQLRGLLRRQRPQRKTLRRHNPYPPLIHERLVNIRGRPRLRGHIPLPPYLRRRIRPQHRRRRREPVRQAVQHHVRKDRHHGLIHRGGTAPRAIDR